MYKLKFAGNSVRTRDQCLATSRADNGILNEKKSYW